MTFPRWSLQTGVMRQTELRLHGVLRSSALFSALMCLCHSAHTLPSDRRMLLPLRGVLFPREGAGQPPALSTFIECPSAALGRKRNGSVDTTPPLGDLLFPAVHPHLGRVGGPT